MWGAHGATRMLMISRHLKRVTPPLALAQVHAIRIAGARKKCLRVILNAPSTTRVSPGRRCQPAPCGRPRASVRRLRGHRSAPSRQTPKFSKRAKAHRRAPRHGVCGLGRPRRPCSCRHDPFWPGTNGLGVPWPKQGLGLRPSIAPGRVGSLRGDGRRFRHALLPPHWLAQVQGAGTKFCTRRLANG